MIPLKVKWVPTMFLADKESPEWEAVQEPVISLADLAEVVEGLKIIANVTDCHPIDADRRDRIRSIAQRLLALLGEEVSRTERCGLCGKETADWVDPDSAHGLRVCRSCDND